MSYDEDIRTLVVLEKARLIAVIVAIAAAAFTVAFESKIFVALRVVAWLAAAVVGVWEARVESRLGRDADGSYLRAVLFAVIGLVNLYLATRA